jgi:hypothetical protein
MSERTRVDDGVRRRIASPLNPPEMRQGFDETGGAQLPGCEHSSEKQERQAYHAAAADGGEM